MRRLTFPHVCMLMPADAATDAKNPVEHAKTTLRERFRSYRTSLSASARDAASAVIVRQVLGLPEVQQAATVHTYWPMVERGEIDTRPLIEKLQAAGTRVVLPVVTGYPPDPPTMAHRTFAGRGALTPNRWGIPEPLAGDPVPPEALDAVIVPALGLGRNGHRIGHGAGFYDAFLHDVPAPKVGLTYDACVVSYLPPAPHDVPLDVIVTESSIFRPAA